jgi:hypothetical protein
MHQQRHQCLWMGRIFALVILFLRSVNSVVYMTWENWKCRAYLKAHRDELKEIDNTLCDLIGNQNPFCFNVHLLWARKNRNCLLLTFGMLHNTALPY